MNRVLWPLIASLLLLLACANSQPGVATGEAAEVTHDGLVRVEKSRRFQRVWVKPGISLAGYSKILPVDAGIHYQKPPRASSQQFPVSEQQIERLSKTLQSIFSEELEKDGDWQIVDQRGPDVLIVRAALIDVYLSAPSRTSGRDDYYTSSVGEATLVVEIFDSESLEILARIAERRAASRDDTTSWRSNSAINQAAGKRLFQAWAIRLRDAMDYARTLTPPEDAGAKPAPPQDEG